MPLENGRKGAYKKSVLPLVAAVRDGEGNIQPVRPGGSDHTHCVRRGSLWHRGRPDCRDGKRETRGGGAGKPTGSWKLGVFRSLSKRCTTRWPGRTRPANGPGTRSDATSWPPCCRCRCRSARSLCTASLPGRCRPRARGRPRCGGPRTRLAAPSFAPVASRPFPACALGRPRVATGATTGPATAARSRTATGCRPETGRLQNTSTHERVTYLRLQDGIAGHTRADFFKGSGPTD